MREAWTEAERRFGRIDGVIHAAGVTRGRTFAPLLELGLEECREQLRAKAVGASVLEELLRDREPDFVVLMSSLSAVLGGLTMGAYAAANLFLDGLAQRKRQAGDRAWTSINWDAWQPRDQASRPPSGAGLAALALTPAEGMAALERVLSARPTSQVVVSTADLQARIDRWVKLASRDAEPQPERRPSPSHHARPALATPYEAPRGETERAIADTWATLLGIAKVGAHDDFFDLGGHSLLATQIVSRLRESHGVEVSLRAFFEAPTVAGLAGTIERLRAAREEPTAPPIVRAPPAERRTLSFAQQRLWFFDQLEPQSPVYNLCLSLRHRGELDGRRARSGLPGDRAAARGPAHDVRHRRGATRAGDRGRALRVHAGRATSPRSRSRSARRRPAAWPARRPVGHSTSLRARCCGQRLVRMRPERSTCCS